MAKPKKPTGTAVASYDEELAKLAGQSATLTERSSGRFFSTRAGVLQFDDAPMPGNQMCAIIGAWCLENVFYAGAYDPENRESPTCFAFCTDPEAKDEMGPPKEVDEHDEFDRQSTYCKDCPQNEWGSAAQGRGKACSNRRRLAILPGGTYVPQGRSGGFELELIEDEDHFRTAEEAFLKIPVMSGKGFDAYVRDVAEQFKKPLFAVYTRIFLTPDPKSQFKVNFEMIDKVDDSLIPALFDRYKKLIGEIDFPYVPFTDDDDGGNKPKAGANKKLTRGGKGRR